MVLRQQLGSQQARCSLFHGLCNCTDDQPYLCALYVYCFQEGTIQFIMELVDML